VQCLHHQRDVHHSDDGSSTHRNQTIIHGVVSQKALVLILPALRTSNLMSLLFLRSVRVYTAWTSTTVLAVYIFVVHSIIIPTMLTDSESDSHLSSSNAVKWWLLSSRGVRKYSVHPVNQKGTKLGEFQHLYQQLKQYSERFYEYLRMLQSTFNYILQLTEPRIHKVYNMYEQPVNIC
jgi:hypothetical protein